MSSTQQATTDYPRLIAQLRSNAGAHREPAGTERRRAADAIEALLAERDAERAIVRATAAAYYAGLEGGDDSTHYPHPEDTLDSMWTELGRSGHSTPYGSDTAPAPVAVANGHAWPCTRFYTSSSNRDRCTCDAATKGQQ